MINASSLRTSDVRQYGLVAQAMKFADQPARLLGFCEAVSYFDHGLAQLLREHLPNPPATLSRANAFKNFEQRSADAAKYARELLEKGERDRGLSFLLAWGLMDMVEFQRCVPQALVPSVRSIA